MNKKIFTLLIFILLFNYVYCEQIPINIKKLNEIKKKKNKLPDGFMLVDENNPNGPITLNREKDDGTKHNLYKNIRIEDDSFYYDYDKFNKLNSTTSKRKEYFCEIKSSYRPEVLKGYDISCPKYYTIKIDKTFYGRFKKDKNHCKIIDNNIYKKIKIRKSCGYEPTKYLKELCENKEYCTIIPTHHFFKNYCDEVSKYLYIEYHCVKDSV